MATNNAEKTDGKTAQSIEDELDGINEGTRRRGSERLRGRIEATIEAKTKKRRNREAPASSAWKR